MKSRIELSDTPISAISKLSDGNPGALNVMVVLFKDGAAVDPDAAFGGLAPILDLDTHEIYGSDIWVLFKDCCGSSALNVHAILRAVQLGIMPHWRMKEAISSGTPLPCAEMLLAVKNRLPRFGGAASEIAAVSQDPESVQVAK